MEAPIGPAIKVGYVDAKGDRIEVWITAETKVAALAAASLLVSATRRGDIQDYATTIAIPRAEWGPAVKEDFDGILGAMNAAGPAPPATEPTQAPDPPWLKDFIEKLAPTVKALIWKAKQAGVIFREMLETTEAPDEQYREDGLTRAAELRGAINKAEDIVDELEAT